MIDSDMFFIVALASSSFASHWAYARLNIISHFRVASANDIVFLRSWTPVL